MSAGLRQPSRRRYGRSVVGLLHRCYATCSE